MSLIRLLAVAALLAIAIAAPSQAQQKHWLVGSWKGALGGISTNNQFGAERTLTVNAVAADGTATGIWESANAKQAIKITVSGDNITFVTPGSQGATYKLTHKGNSLDGSWQGSGTGKSGPITLTKP